MREITLEVSTPRDLPQREPQRVGGRLLERAG
jgi:hypothetical protein